MRRIDPRHRSLGQFFQDEIATPLGLDVYIRLPETIPPSRLATLMPPGPIDMLRGYPLWLIRDALNPRSNIHRALMTNPGQAIALDAQQVYARNLEVPSGGGVGTVWWSCGTRSSATSAREPTIRSASSTRRRFAAS